MSGGDYAGFSSINVSRNRRDSGYSFVSTMSGSACARSVRITYNGGNAPPRIVSSGSGDCGSDHRQPICPQVKPKSLGADFARPAKRAIRHDYQAGSKLPAPAAVDFQEICTVPGFGGKPDCSSVDELNSRRFLFGGGWPTADRKASAASAKKLSSASNSVRLAESAKRLWRLAEHAEKGAAHPFLVAKTSLGCDDFNGVSALLDHQPRCVEPEPLDSLSR